MRRPKKEGYYMHVGEMERPSVAWHEADLEYEIT